MAQAKLHGAEAIRRTLAKLGADGPRELAAALYQEAEAIMARSKTIVPVDTGALRASGHVQLPDTVGDKVSVRMGYGGAAAGYAVAVHEKLNVRHKSPTKAKYLEEPFRAAESGMLNRIAATLRQAVERIARAAAR